MCFPAPQDGNCLPRALEARPKNAAQGGKADARKQHEWRTQPSPTRKSGRSVEPLRQVGMPAPKRCPGAIAADQAGDWHASGVLCRRREQPHCKQKAEQRKVHCCAQPAFGNGSATTQAEQFTLPPGFECGTEAAEDGSAACANACDFLRGVVGTSHGCSQSLCRNPRQRLGNSCPNVCYPASLSPPRPEPITASRCGRQDLPGSGAGRQSRTDGFRDCIILKL